MLRYISRTIFLGSLMFYIPFNGIIGWWGILLGAVIGISFAFSFEDLGFDT